MWSKLILVCILCKFSLEISVQVEKFKTIPQVLNADYANYTIETSPLDPRVETGLLTLKKNVSNLNVRKVTSKTLIFDWFFFQFQVQIVIKVLRLNLTVVNESINLCKSNMKNVKNIYLKSFLPVLLYILGPLTKCPIAAGTYKLNLTGSNDERDFQVKNTVVKVVKNMKLSNVNATYIYFTEVNMKRVDVLKINDYSRICLVD